MNIFTWALGGTVKTHRKRSDSEILGPQKPSVVKEFPELQIIGGWKAFRILTMYLHYYVWSHSDQILD